MGGWTTQERQDGGHEVLYVDDDISEAPLIATFCHAVLVEESIKEALHRPG